MLFNMRLQFLSHGEKWYTVMSLLMLVHWLILFTFTKEFLGCRTIFRYITNEQEANIKRKKNFEKQTFRHNPPLHTFCLLDVTKNVLYIKMVFKSNAMVLASFANL